MHNDTFSTSLLSFMSLIWNFFHFTDYKDRSSRRGCCIYFFNFKKRSSRVRAGFIGMIFPCVCIASVADFSHLPFFEGIDVISAVGSLKSSRDVSAVRPSAGLAIISYSISDNG